MVMAEIKITLVFMGVEEFDIGMAMLVCHFL
jgi:hypothetical protein